VTISRPAANREHGGDVSTKHEPREGRLTGFRASPGVSWIRPVTAAGRVSRFLTIIAVGGIALGACLAALIPGIVIIGTAHHYTSDVDTSLDQLSEPSYIYDAAGNQLDVLAREDRRPIESLSEVPKHVQNAVIAIEDQTFWENEGYDLNALIRAAWANFTAGEIEQGGSTITQQLAKNRVVCDARDPLDCKQNLRRKIRELIVAKQLSEEYSKEEILKEYFNTVYFGEGAYGIKSAADRFFGVTPDQLTLGQGALLAGVIQNPTVNNPWNNFDKAAARREEVLDQMVEQDMITKREAKFAVADPASMPNPFIRPPETTKVPQDYYTQEVYERLLQDPRLGDNEQARQAKILRGGLQIYTPWDPNLQASAQSAVDRLQPNQPFRSSILAMDPRTGEVKAFVAGPGFNDPNAGQYNLATQPPGRQPGSSWKIITLTEAIEQGYSPNDTINGSSPCRVGDYTTVNAGDTGGGGTLRASAVGSVNCAFVRLLSALGVAETADMANRLGITQEIPPAGDPRYPGLTMTLGTVEATPLEMATVASTLANGGIRHDPVFYTRVVGPEGEVIIDESTNPGEQAVDPAVASCVVDVLRGVLISGTAAGLRPDGHPNAFGKTGTTDGTTDAWFVGATPQLAAAVWSGNPFFNQPGVGYGGEVSAPIWQAFMNEALSGQPVEDFAPPQENCDAPGRSIQEFVGRTGEEVADFPDFPTPEPQPQPTQTAPLAPLPPSTAPAPTLPSTTSTTTTTLPGP
jgi:membrane peptidoglycan carboxypeptidase